MQLATMHVAWKIRFQYQKLGVATCEHNKAYVHKTILFRFGKHWTSRWRDLGMWILHNQGNWWCNWHHVVQKNKVKESWVATIEQNKTYIYTRQSQLDFESTEQMDGGEICACEFYMIKVLSDTIGTMLVWKNKVTESWSCKKHLSPTRDTYIHKTITFGFGKSTQHTNGTNIMKHWWWQEYGKDKMIQTCVLGNSVSPTTAWSSGERLHNLFKPPAPPVLFFFSFGKLPNRSIRKELQEGEPTLSFFFFFF